MSKRLIKAEEVEKHTTDKSCWVVIHNKVYDVTKFLPEHPGSGEILLDASGKDSTAEFENFDHSKDARDQMTEFFIGDLDPASVWKPKAKAKTTSNDQSSPMNSILVALVLVVIAACILYM